VSENGEDVKKRRRRVAIGRLGFHWWGRFWRGWLQCGHGFTVVADKDYTVQAKSFLFGPLEIDWWSRTDWQDFCFTAEEAAAEDAREEASIISQCPPPVDSLN